jgi:hypothetical protein
MCHRRPVPLPERLEENRHGEIEPGKDLPAAPDQGVIAMTPGKFSRSVENTPKSLGPICLMVRRMEAEIPATKMPYSTAALPDSSLTNSAKLLVICADPL